MMHLEAFNCDLFFLLSQPQRVVEKLAKSSAEHVHIAHEIMVIILFARSIFLSDAYAYYSGHLKGFAFSLVKFILFS